MPVKLYKVKLTTTERQYLENIVSSETEKARRLIRTQILLKTNEGWEDKQIKEALVISCPTIRQVRKNYAEQGLIATINRKPSPRHYQRKLDARKGTS